MDATIVVAIVAAAGSGVTGWFSYKGIRKAKQIESDSQTKTQMAITELETKKLNIEAFERSQAVMMKAMDRLEQQAERDDALIDELRREVINLQEHIDRLQEEIRALKNEVKDLKTALLAQGIRTETEET